MPNEALPPVSIIIPTLNEEQYLPLLLESLLETHEPIDVIVVDGESTDSTVARASLFRSRFSSPSSLRILPSPRGLSRQRNVGAKAALHNMLLFLDADVIIPSRTTYRELVSSYVSSGRAVGVAHIMPVENIFRARVVYQLFDWTQRVFLLFGQPYLGTFCLMTTKQIFAAVGGFDEAKPITEDIDFCFRASRHGAVGQLPVHIPVSARRFIKYGYWHVFWIYLKEGFVFLTTRKARLEKIVYPFGEYAAEPVKAK